MPDLPENKIGFFSTTICYNENFSIAVQNLLCKRENYWSHKTYISTKVLLRISHYGIIYHVHHPFLLFSYINILMQIIYIKGTA